MQYQKMKNLPNKTNDQPSKFRTRDWVKINDILNEIYEICKQIELCTSMLKSSLCDYIGAYMLWKGTITFADAAARVSYKTHNQPKPT